jgi:hypothetical protein
MRSLAVLSFTLALAGPAAAQVAPHSLPDPADNLRWMEQESQRQRLLQLERDVTVLENRMRTEEAIRGLETQRYRTAEARANVARSLAASRAAPGKTGDIPDEALARSNQRVREASRR